MRLWRMLLAAALASPSFLPAGPAEAEGFYQRGLKLERVRSYSSAATFYEAAIAKDPKFAPAFRGLGNCHYYLGDKVQAAKDYQAYLLLRPDDKAIAALMAKLIPPTPTPVPEPAGGSVMMSPPPTGTPDSAFFKRPGWQEGVDLDEGRAQGRFQVPLDQAMDRAAAALSVEGLGPLVKGFGKMHTHPLQINRGTLQGTAENQGDNSVYSLQAVFKVYPSYVQVQWKLFKIYDVFYGAEEPQPGTPGTVSAVSAPPSLEESRQNDQRVLDEGLQVFREKGLPQKPVELLPAIDLKLQRDWNWRLWQQLRPTPDARGVIVVKGWSKPNRNIVAYNLYMSEQSGVGFRKMNDQPITAMDYRVENLLVGKRYYFVMTGVKADGTESRQSVEWSMTAATDTK